MNIIIVGSNAIGVELAEYLVNGGHAVTLVDKPSTEMTQIGNRLDLRVVQGMPSYPSILKKAGAENAELIVATTQDDELNIAVCSVASSLFRIPRKIARIRATEYLQEKDELFGNDSIPIDHIISPEHLVTDSVLDLINFLGAMAVSHFCNNRVLVIQAKAKVGGELIGKPIKLLDSYDKKAKFLALYRNNMLLEKYQDEVLQVDDEVFFCAESSRALHFLSALTQLQKRDKNIFIAGGTHIADVLAVRLSQKYRVKLLEPSEQRAERIASRFKDTSVELFCADPTNLDFYYEEHIEKSSLVIAATPFDESNVMTSLILRKLNNMRTISILRNKTFIDLQKGVGQEGDIVVSPKDATISALLSNIRQEGVEKVRLFRQGSSEDLELRVRGSKIGSKIVGKKLDDIHLPKNAFVGLVVRDGAVLKIDNDFRFADEDRLIVYLHDQTQSRALVKLFKPRSFWIGSW